MIAAKIMKIDCARLTLGSSLYAALKSVAETGNSALAVIDADGLFVGSLHPAALVAELSGGLWHCGHANLTGTIEDAAGVGIASLIDREAPRVGPETPAIEVSRLLVSSSGPSSVGSRLALETGFVAVVDNSGLFLGSITHADLISRLLAVSRSE